MTGFPLGRALRLALLVPGLALSGLAVSASPAWAHAAFTSSRPEPGTQLAAAPGVVEIEFTEPLIADLSSLRVTDPDGRAWEGSSAGERSLRVPLDTNAQGVYEVVWKTVSPIDGHTLRGSFRFGVGVIPEEVEEVATVEPQTPDVLAVARAAEFGGLLVAVGMLLMGRLAKREPAFEWVRIRPARALGVALAAGTVVVVGEALLAAPRLSVMALARYLTAEPGLLRLTRLGAVLGGLLASRMSRRGLAASFVVAALGALAAGGHAAATRPVWWGITTDAGHLLGAALWAGGILALAMLRPPDGWRSEEARALLRRFSPVAVGAFLATVAFGSLRGTQELVRLADLFATSYGQVLTLKIAAVALMLPLSLRAWRRRYVRPRIEGGLAIVAIGAAALLAAYPVPPRRAAEDVEADVAGENPAVPREGDLTFGGDTGDVLVGLTLRPGRQGRNDVLVYLLPTQGKEAAAGLSASLTVGDGTVPLSSCGLTCRRGEAVIEDRDTLEVTVAYIEDEPARFTLPELPTPDGQPLLTQLVGRMDRVSRLRYEEVFGPVAPPIRSTVEMVAPDRIRVLVHTFDRETIRLGDDMFRRQGDQPWEVQLEGAQVHVPTYVWEYEPRVAARILGSQQLAGVPTRIVSFFIDHSTGPIWYRLWVDDQGLVRRAEMRTQGHFMDHDYSDFDAPISIHPPRPRRGGHQWAQWLGKAWDSR